MVNEWMRDDGWIDEGWMDGWIKNEERMKDD